MAESYIPVFLDWVEVTEQLNDQEKGRLVDALVLYARGEDWQDRIKGNERFLFPAIKAKIDFYNNRPKGAQKGEYHWNWRGGITPENQKGRSSGEYAEWRKKVFERDGYTCRRCGKKGGRLNAHHIERWAENCRKRYDVSNGVTLCEKCHKDIHRKA